MGKIIRRNIGHRVYLYYAIRTDEGPRHIYLGPEDKPDASKIISVLEILDKRAEKLYQERNELEMLLPEEERRRLPEAPQITGEHTVVELQQQIEVLFSEIQRLEQQIPSMSPEVRVFAGPSVENMKKALNAMQKRLQ